MGMARSDMVRQVVVVPHDPHWKTEFMVEADRVEQAIGPAVVNIHHIGSTAIPGIHAKPIIDLLVEVIELPPVDAAKFSMAALGYEALGEFGLPGRRYFQKTLATGDRTHHVHVFEVSTPEVDRHLAFRDYLIAHPTSARQYSDLKQQLAQAHPTDIESYMDGKHGLIRQLERAALQWRKVPVRPRPTRPSRSSSSTTAGHRSI